MSKQNEWTKKRELDEITLYLNLNSQELNSIIKTSNYLTTQNIKLKTLVEIALDKGYLKKINSDNKIFVDSNNNTDSIELKLDTLSDKATIIGNGITANTAQPVIPKFVYNDGVIYQICYVSDKAFKDNTHITKITFPGYLEAIGNQSFEGCTNLADVEFPETLNFLGIASFKGCTALTTFGFNEGLVTIPRDCFSGCTRLDNLTLPTSLIEIQSSGFKDCTTLSSIEFSEKFKLLGENSFNGCIALSTITMKDSILEIIPTACFNGCTSLASIELPKTIKSIEANAFNGCTTLGTFSTFPVTINNIGNSAFQNINSTCTITLTGTQNYISFTKDMIDNSGLTDAGTVTIRYPKTLKEEDVKAVFGTTRTVTPI